MTLSNLATATHSVSTHSLHHSYSDEQVDKGIINGRQFDVRLPGTGGNRAQSDKEIEYKQIPKYELVEVRHRQQADTNNDTGGKPTPRERRSLRSVPQEQWQRNDPVSSSHNSVNSRAPADPFSMAQDDQSPSTVHPRHDVTIPEDHAFDAQANLTPNVAGSWTHISQYDDQLYSVPFPPAEPAMAQSHPDVVDALTSLEARLHEASANAPISAKKAIQPLAKSSVLKLLKSTQKHSEQPLQAHSADVYKQLVSFTSGTNTQQIATSLAALTQRATAEGYEAVVKQLVENTLNPRLQSLPNDTLYQLACLQYSDDKIRTEILTKTTNLLGTNQRGTVRQVEHARKQAEVAEALLVVIARLAHEHFRAKTWDQQVAIALSAVNQGQHQLLSAALREMWSGDLLMGEKDRTRVERLMDSVQRLPAHQQEDLARTLGMAARSSSESNTFSDFETEYLPKYESDDIMHEQLIKFIVHLRLATWNVVQQNNNSHREFSVARASVRDESPKASYLPAAQRSSARRLYNWVRNSFRRVPREQVNAKVHIKQAFQSMIAGGAPIPHLDALQSAYDDLQKQAGHAAGPERFRVMVQDRLSKQKPEQLEQLGAQLAQARGEIPSLTPEHAKKLQRLYDQLNGALTKESGIRLGAAALTQVAEALPQRPETLLNALDNLARASSSTLDRQSEMEFYENALQRLDSKQRSTLQKYLHGRHGVSRYVQSLQSLIGPGPSAWLQFRWDQLATLAQASAKYA